MKENLEALNRFFLRVGFETCLLIMNIGTLMHGLILLVLGLVIKPLFRKCARLHKFLHGLTSVAILLRFFIQTYFDFILLSMVNISTAEWSSGTHGAVIYSNLFSIFSFIACILMPIVLICRYMKKDDWNKADFKERYGPLIEGQRVEQLQVE